jgi:site-specific DNA recombinase
MGDFLKGQPTAITEFDEPFLRLLIEKGMIYEDKYTVEFKSGISLDISEQVGKGSLLV